MRKSVFIQLIGILVVFFATSNSYAQATRTWISGVGDDANPCSRTAPCKTYAGAISKTAAGGEINTLDSGGFGGVTITKSISLISRGVEAGVLVSGTNAIVINVLSSDTVHIDGLDIEGLGTGLSGVKVVGSGRVFIKDTRVHNFATGVDVVGTAGARVFIENSSISGNGVGINVAGQSGVFNRAIVYDSTIDSDSVASLQVGAGATVTLSRSKLQGAPVSIVNNGGTVESYGDNILRPVGSVTVTVPKN